MNGQRISQTNRIRNLNEASMAESISYHRLGNIASIVSSRSVDLRLILSGEGTTSMRSPATVGVNNNFSASQTCISLRSSDVKLSRRVDYYDGVLQHVGRNDLLDDLLSESLPDNIILNFGIVLSRDKDVVHSDWIELSVLQFFILTDDLRLAIGSQPRN